MNTLHRLWLRLQIALVGIATEQAERVEALAARRLEALAQRELKLRTTLTAITPVTGTLTRHHLTTRRTA